MSRSTAIRAALIFLFGFGVLVAAQPFGASDAEAKRGFGRAAVGGVSAYRAANRDNPSEDNSEQSNSADEQTPDAENADTPASETATRGDAKPEEATSNEPATAAVVTPVTPAPEAAKPVILKALVPDVPGCAAGMMCTVCVAGCNGTSNSIIHVMPKLNR